MSSPADKQPAIPTYGEWQPVPAVAPGVDRKTDQKPRFGTALVEAVANADWLTRIILGVVMTAALAVGTWSVYTLLTDLFHAPRTVAILGCGMFDGAAFFFARLSQRYATTTDSGLGPRTAMLVMICTSAWVNWQHAQLKHWGTVGGVVLAAAPVVAELAFEMWHRYEHREALRSLGRVAQTLPVLGKWAWLTHPGRSRKVLDAHIRAGLTETEALAERRHDLAHARARSIIAAPVETETTNETTSGLAPLETVETETVDRRSLPACETETSAPETNRETETTAETSPAETSLPASVETETTQVAPETKTRRTVETTTVPIGDRGGDRDAEIELLVSLMETRGGDMKVSLNDAIRETGRPKATAAKRLAAARDRYRKSQRETETA